MEPDTIECVLSEYFQTQARFVIDAAYLFGSQARRTARLESDVDVAALFREKPEPVFPTPALLIQCEIDRLLPMPAQIICLNDAPLDLVHRVLRDGRLVWEGSRSHRIAFEVRARNLYFDLFPFLRRYRHRPVHA